VPNKEKYPGTPVWGLGVGHTFSPHRNLPVSKPWPREDKRIEAPQKKKENEEEHATIIMNRKDEKLMCNS
jgi:hypothetical protein